jgi:hypothetical protein
MKKILSLFAVLFVSVQLFAAAPTAPTLYNNTSASIDYAANIYKTGNPNGAVSTGRDSLIGVDSIVLLKKFSIDPKFLYRLQILDSGGVADTSKYEIQYFFGDKNGTEYKTASSLIDSAAGSAPAAGIKRLKSIDLAVNTTSWPMAVTVLVKKPVAALIYKIYRVELIKTQPYYVK